MLSIEKFEMIGGNENILQNAISPPLLLAENTERKIGVRSGSFDRRGVTFSSPFHIGEINGGLSFFYEKVGPTEQIVEADRQALSDTVFLTSASETPGEINNGISTIFRRVFNWEASQLRFQYHGGIWICFNGNILNLCLFCHKALS